MYRTNFYFTKHGNDYRTLWHVQHCTRPGSTKAYKTLANWLDRGIIESYAWERAT